jgi:hypothetical protein
VRYSGDKRSGWRLRHRLPDADGRARICPIKKHSLPMKSPDSKYLIDAPAFSEHHGREWPTNKTTDIYLSAINLQRSPFNTSDMRLFPRSMEASGGPQKLC